MIKNYIINNIKSILNNRMLVETISICFAFSIALSVIGYFIDGSVNFKIGFYSVSYCLLCFQAFLFYSLRPKFTNINEKSLVQFINDMNQNNIKKVLFYSKGLHRETIVQTKSGQDYYTINYSFNEIKDLLDYGHIKSCNI